MFFLFLNGVIKKMRFLLLFSLLNLVKDGSRKIPPRKNSHMEDSHPWNSALKNSHLEYSHPFH